MWIFPWIKLGWLNWFWSIDAWSCSLCKRRTSFSIENSVDSYLCFWLALLHSVSNFFFLYRSPSLLLCMVFYSISSNMMKFSQSTHLLLCLSLKTLLPIVMAGSHILVELIDLVNSVIIFLSQITLRRWLTFLLRSLTVILTVLSFGFISFYRC